MRKLDQQEFYFQKNDFNCFPTSLKLKGVQVDELILVDRLGNPF